MFNKPKKSHQFKKTNKKIIKSRRNNVPKTLNEIWDLIINNFFTHSAFMISKAYKFELQKIQEK